jgi:hypothetical protein
MEENDMSAKSLFKKTSKMDDMNETYSTKEDLYQVESRLDGKISEVKEDLHKAEFRLDGKISEVKEDLHKAEFRLENKISEAKYDLIKWMVSLWVAQTALFLTLFLRK